MANDQDEIPARPSPDSDPEVAAGQEVRRLRIARGWSQEELGRRMKEYGYTWGQAMVAKVEAAGRPLRVRELVDFAALFGVPVLQLMTPQIPLEDVNAEIAELGAQLLDATAALTVAEAKMASSFQDAEAARAAVSELRYTVNRIESRLMSLRERRAILTGAEDGS